MAFMEFLKELYDIELQYRPELAQGGGYGGPAARPGGSPLDALLGQLQGGAEAGRPGRMGGPFMGGPPGAGGPINLAGPPSAGDMVDMNNEVGGSPLAGLLGRGPAGSPPLPPGVPGPRRF
jgi:hypothetical protein